PSAAADVLGMRAHGTSWYAGLTRSRTTMRHSRLTCIVVQRARSVTSRAGADRKEPPVSASQQPEAEPSPARRTWRIDGRAVLLGLRTWTLRRSLVAVAVAALIGVLIGLATVLIPNPVFVRDIPPVWWNTPVLVLMAALTGMLAATYVRPGPAGRVGPTAGGEPGVPASGDGGSRGTRMGIVGTVLTWFAVGCPVCNKIALVALGYTGALTYLAWLALAVPGFALVWRLQWLAACPGPRRAARAAA